MALEGQAGQGQLGDSSLMVGRGFRFRDKPVKASSGLGFGFEGVRV